MTILWFNHKDILKNNLQQKNLFTFTVVPDFQHNNKLGRMTIPWINYEVMKEITYKQKNVFLFSSTSDFQHKNDECNGNCDVPCKSDLNVGAIGLDILGDASKRTKRSKLHKKRKRYRKIITNETYSNFDEPADCTHVNDYETGHTNEHNKSMRPRLSSLTIPFATFTKIYNTLQPPEVNSSIFAEDTEHDFQTDDSLKLDSVSCPKHKTQVDDVLESNSSPLKLDDTETHDTIELNKHIEASKTTIKIPMSIFRKKYNSLHPSASLSKNSIDDTEDDFQMEVVTKHVADSKPNHNLKEEDDLKSNSLEDYLVENETKDANELNKDSKVTKSSINIPMSIFRKKYNSLHPPVTFSATFATVNEQAADLKHKHDSNVENVMESNVSEKKLVSLETEHSNEIFNHSDLRSMTVKIPMSTFRKIYNSLHPPLIDSTIHTNTNEFIHQIDDEIVSRPDHNAQVKDISEKVTSKVTLVDSETDYADETTQANEQKKHTRVRSMTLKIPVSTCAEIDNFLHPPIFGNTIQNTFKFIDPNNKQTPRLATKLFDTITYYHEEPYCQLVGFKSHEIIMLNDFDLIYPANTKAKNEYYRSAVIPIHDSISMKISEASNNTCPSDETVNIKVPVIVGEYNIEICLEENVLIEENIYKVTDISKGFSLTNCKFVPAIFSHSKADEALKASRGKLFIEGFIHQDIEYLTVHNGEKNFSPKNLENFSTSLQQTIVLELMVQLLQIQKVTIVVNQRNKK